MSKLMERLTYEHLNNEAHVAFHETACRILASHNPATLGVGEQYADYKTSYDEEVTTLELVRAEPRILEIEDQDYLVNSIYRGMFDTVKSMLNHVHEDKRIASFHITLLVSYYDKVFLDPDSDEILTMDDLMRDLNENLISQILALRVHEWILLIERENEKLTQLVSTIQSETSRQPEIRVRPARNKVDKTFGAMLDRIDALAIINGAKTFEALAKELNRHTERYEKWLRERPVNYKL